MTSPRIQLDCYQGPLDLLVQLVRHHEVDVLRIAIAQIAQSYLACLEDLTELDLAEVGDFLVLAATLMEFKSRLLLPRQPDEQDEEEAESRQELVRQLLEYKRFKQVAALLWERAREQRRMFRRDAADLPPQRIDPASQPIRELELWDLVSAFSRLMRENIVPVGDRVLLDPTPIAVYMERLAARVIETGGLTFRELIGTHNTRPQLIGKFLALLELIKSAEVWVELDGETDEIHVLPPRAPLPKPEETVVMASPSVPPDAALREEDARSAGPSVTETDSIEEDGSESRADGTPAGDGSEVITSEKEKSGDPAAGTIEDPWSEADSENQAVTTAAWADFEPISEGETEGLPEAGGLSSADTSLGEERPPSEGSSPPPAGPPRQPDPEAPEV